MPTTITPVSAATIGLAGARCARIDGSLPGAATRMRQGELLGACWPDVDFAHNRIHVTQQLKRVHAGSMDLGATKTSTSRRLIPLPPGVLEQLKAFRARDNARRLADPTWNPHRFIVVSTAGHHAWPGAINTELKLLCAQARIPPFTSHAMRHTYASLLAAAGVPASVVQDLLGHADMDMTAYYTHVYTSHLAEAAATLADLFTPAGKTDGPTDGLLGPDSADNVGSA